MDQNENDEHSAEFANQIQRVQGLVQDSTANAMAKATGKEFSVLDSGTVAQAYARAGMKLAQNPFALAQFQIDLWSNSAKAWAGAWAGEGEDSKDRRFRDGRWTSDPLSRSLRDVHLAIEGAADRLIETLPEGDKDSLRVRFYTRQLLSALSPNTAATTCAPKFGGLE